MAWFQYKGKNFFPPPEEVTHQILLVESGIIQGWVYELSVHPCLHVEACVRRENCTSIKVFREDSQTSEEIPDLLFRAKKAVLYFISIQR